MHCAACPKSLEAQPAVVPFDHEVEAGGSSFQVLGLPCLQGLESESRFQVLHFWCKEAL